MAGNSYGIRRVQRAGTGAGEPGGCGKRGCGRRGCGRARSACTSRGRFPGPAAEFFEAAAVQSTSIFRNRRRTFSPIATKSIFAGPITAGSVLRRSRPSRPRLVRPPPGRGRIAGAVRLLSARPGRPPGGRQRESAGRLHRRPQRDVRRPGDGRNQDHLHGQLRYRPDVRHDRQHHSGEPVHRRNPQRSPSPLSPAGGNATTDVAIYEVTAPDAGGIFTSADNGTYRVILGLNQVYDPTGSEAPQTAATFKVNAPPAGAMAPAAAITPPAAIVTAASSLTVTVTNTATSGSGDSVTLQPLIRATFSSPGPTAT